jgi:hypothetical protein
VNSLGKTYFRVRFGGPGEVHRSRIAYTQSTLSASLKLLWSQAKGSGWSVVPGSALSLNYGLAATATTADSAPAGVAGVQRAGAVADRLHRLRGQRVARGSTPRPCRAAYAVSR